MRDLPVVLYRAISLKSILGDPFDTAFTCLRDALLCLIPRMRLLWMFLCPSTVGLRR